MSSLHRFPSVCPAKPNRVASRRARIRFIVLAAVGAFACNANDRVTTPDLVELKSITIDSGGRILERGERDTLTATVLDRVGSQVKVPLVWRSSNEKVAVFDPGGQFVALDTGTTAVVAVSLGVVSQPVAFRVVWLGPAKIAAGSWTARTSSPDVTLADSVRVTVTNVAGAPVAGAKVAFSVTEGGGAMSPAIATTGPTGTAAAAWTLGGSAGANTVSASVVGEDGTSNPFVANNAVTFEVKTYQALVIDAGNNQVGQVLSGLPISPAVKLVDSLGAPRAGVPVSFTAFGNSSVANTVVSTGADGVATAGKWTLGDIPGAQSLVARFEDAQVTLSASATGSPVYYTPAEVVAGGFSTCARETSGTVKCWGEVPQIGSGGASSVSTPTSVQGALVATSISGSPTHYCATGGTGAASCWGLNALVDPSGLTTNAGSPTVLPGSITWGSIAPGLAHSCGISSSQDAYCWGNNASGQLGDNTNATRFVPGLVTGGFKYSKIAGGTDHSCALTTGGVVLCWGGNQFGQIGDGTTTSRTGATTVAGGLTFQSVGVGDGHSCGLATDGKVFCWGRITSQSTPTAFAGAPTFVSLSVGAAHACALTADGTAYCWGANSSGQLGDSTTVSRITPTRLAGGFRFTQVSAGHQHTCGLTTAGTVACWGLNRSGELGNNILSIRTVPRRVVVGVIP